MNQLPRQQKRSSAPCSQRYTQRDLRMSGELPLAASAIAVAGVVAWHEAGHFLAAKVQGMKVHSFNIGYGPKLLSFNDSTDTEFALRALPLGGYVAFPTNVELDDEGEVIKELDDVDLLQNRPPLQRGLVISAGVLANLLLTFLLLTGTAATAGISRPEFGPGLLVPSVVEPTLPAGQAGLKVKDVILSVNGKPIAGPEGMEYFISAVRSSPDEPIPLEILRNGKTAPLVVTPVATGTAQKGSIGLPVEPLVKAVQVQRGETILDSASIGFKETCRLVAFTWGAFSRSVASGFIGNEVGGPISVIKAGAQFAEVSPTALVDFAATLSVNLAILNSLPFPALDGGQLVFVLLELLAGKPVPRRIKDTITGLAFSVLLVIGASTLISDVSKMFVGL